MIVFGRIWRVFVLALSLLFTSHTVVHAHALPGTVITISPDDTGLAVTIRMPVEDLLIAAPDLMGMADNEQDTPLNPSTLHSLSDYLHGHMSLMRNGQAMPVELERATMAQAEHHDVGLYPVLDLTVSLPDTALPLALQYDAIMHEVRTHRATIIWASDGIIPVPIAEFGYRLVNGVMPTIVIDNP